jgi:hypothetical protein
MKGPDVTLTNGRYEFRSSTRGSILYLAKPPEAGWRLEAQLDGHEDDAGRIADTAPSSTESRRRGC